MRVIHRLYGKEIRSRNFRAIRELGKEYTKKGAQTEISLYDSCNQMWNLRVREPEQRNMSQMGQMYKP